MLPKTRIEALYLTLYQWQLMEEELRNPSGNIPWDMPLKEYAITRQAGNTFSVVTHGTCWLCIHTRPNSCNWCPVTAYLVPEYRSFAEEVTTCMSKKHPYHAYGYGGVTLEYVTTIIEEIRRLIRCEISFLQKGER